MIAFIHTYDLFAGVYQTMTLIGRARWFVGHRPVAVVVLAEPLPFVSRDVSLQGQKPIVECAVGFLVAGKDAGQAHHVGDVTPYANSLFYFVIHDFVGVGLTLLCYCFFNGSALLTLMKSGSSTANSSRSNSTISPVLKSKKAGTMLL